MDDMSAPHLHTLGLADQTLEQRSADLQTLEQRPAAIGDLASRNRALQRTQHRLMPPSKQASRCYP